MSALTNDNVQLIKNSALFDASWYCQQYPDVSALQLDPATHYLQLGWRLGRNPSAAFCSDDYLKANPDVAKADLNPLLHFLQKGQQENRPLLDPLKHSEMLLLDYVTHKLKQFTVPVLKSPTDVSVTRQKKLEHYFIKTLQLQRKLQQLQDI